MNLRFEQAEQAELGELAEYRLHGLEAYHATITLRMREYIFFFAKTRIGRISKALIWGRLALETKAATLLATMSLGKA